MVAMFAQLEFAYPARLYWLAVLLLVGYFAVRTRVSGPAWRRAAAWFCRSLALALLILAFSGVRWRAASNERFVVLVEDVSRSVSDDADTAQQFIAAAVEKRQRHHTAVLRFAERPGELRTEANGPAEELGGLASDPAAALRFAVASIPENFVPQVVLLSDGNDTAGDLVKAASDGRVPISIKPLQAFAGPEVCVATVLAPSRAGPTGDVTIDVVVASNHQEQAALELLRDQQVVEKKELELIEGDNRATFQASLGDRPAAVFEVRLRPAQDTLAENNRRRVMVFAAPRLQVLLIDRDPPQAGPLRSLLAAQNLEVTLQAPAQLPAAAEGFAKFDLVLLSNVTPKDLDSKQVVALHRYVGLAGGGLVVFGGEQTFGEAAYEETRDARLERMLPVKSLHRETQRKSVRAMVLVIDRSGSMEDENRIGLAKQAAKSAVQLLEPQDKIGVLAFSDEATWVAPISICSNKAQLAEQIDTLTPLGQTQMYDAVERAYLALEQTDADRRHIVLLTDGTPSPGDFDQVARRMAKSGITLSTIAIGQDADQDILKDMARIARGRHHSCVNPADIPKALSEETQAVVSGTRPQEFAPFVFRKLPGLDVATAPTLQGYAATDPKPNAELLLLAAGGDPLLGWWRYGAGITVVFTTDASDRGAKRWYGWNGFGPFWRRLARHAARVPQAERSTLRIELSGNTATATLDALGEGWEFLNGASVQMSLTRPDQSQEKLAAVQVAPGRYQARFAADQQPGPFVVEAAVEATTAASNARQALFVDYPEELRLQPTNESLLRSLAAASGGMYDPAPEKLFESDGRTVDRVTVLWSQLVLAALLLFVADVALRRLRF